VSLNETFLTLYMTVNWHREFAVNFATFLKVCRDFFSLLHRDFRTALVICVFSCAWYCGYAWTVLDRLVPWLRTAYCLTARPLVSLVQFSYHCTDVENVSVKNVKD